MNLSFLNKPAKHYLESISALGNRGIKGTMELQQVILKRRMVRNLKKDVPVLDEASTQ